MDNTYTFTVKELRLLLDKYEYYRCQCGHGREYAKSIVLEEVKDPLPKEVR